MANLSTLFGGGIKSIQAGVITIGAGNLTGTATITAVNTGKAFLLNGGATSVVTGTPDNSSIELVLTNSTTVTASRTGTGGTAPTVSWTVVEFF